MGPKYLFRSVWIIIVGCCVYWCAEREERIGSKSRNTDRPADSATQQSSRSRGAASDGRQTLLEQQQVSYVFRFHKIELCFQQSNLESTVDFNWSYFSLLRIWNKLTFLFKWYTRKSRFQYILFRNQPKVKQMPNHDKGRQVRRFITNRNHSRWRQGKVRRLTISSSRPQNLQGRLHNQVVVVHDKNTKLAFYKFRSIKMESFFSVLFVDKCSCFKTYGQATAAKASGDVGKISSTTSCRASTC